MFVRYLTGKAAQAVFVLWAAFTATFAIIYLLPGDSVSTLYENANSDAGSLSEDELNALRAKYGLDKPLILQYLYFLGRAVTLDFGTSISRRRPVLELIGENVGPTTLLAGCSLVIAVVVGVSIAVASQYARFAWLRGFFVRLPWAAGSFPTFWIGLILIQVFSFTLRWFPSGGTGGVDTLVLPSIVMAIPGAATLAQVLSRSLGETRGEPYVVTATAKGIRESVVFGRHVLRNAVLPTLTILGMLVAGTVTGAVISETIFSRPGIGRLTQQAVTAQDLPLVQGIVLVAASSFVIVNLVIDAVYPLFDPRIVVGRARA